LTRQVILDGVGLHTGAQVRTVLEVCSGPVLLHADGARAAIEELTVVSSARSTTVEARASGLRVATVEHLLAALAGLGIRDGVAIGIDGPEMPLLGGGAKEWCDALRQLGVAPRRAKLRVVREAAIEVGPSRYELSPCDGTRVEVSLEFDDARLAPNAFWQGDADDFQWRIAPARTFAFSAEVDELLRGGLVRHVDRGSVLLISPEAIHCAGRPFSPDEPARHKLLDLLGDAYLHGGPPMGRLRAIRPGHAANARAFRQAIDAGVLVLADGRAPE
jgi:UDP-3-O-[3-hydroxymyristoyl] N-acetylglucosamine deacetylase